LTKLGVTEGDIGDYAFGPVAWSRDGRRLAFSHCVEIPGRFSQGVTCHLETVGVDGRGRRKLPFRRGNNDTQPDWSPAGRMIAFARSPSAPTSASAPGSIRVVRADGKGARMLARSLHGCFEPLWSLDGRTVAFVQGTGDSTRSLLKVVSSRGGQARQIAVAHGFLGLSEETDVSWSPNGRLLAFTRDTYDASGLAATGIDLVAVDGTGLRRLVRGPHFDSYAVWQPTSKP
jgi:Tol biopolymer transport system component